MTWLAKRSEGSERGGPGVLDHPIALRDLPAQFSCTRAKRRCWGCLSANVQCSSAVLKKQLLQCGVGHLTGRRRFWALSVRGIGDPTVGTVPTLVAHKYLPQLPTKSQGKAEETDYSTNRRKSSPTIYGREFVPSTIYYHASRPFSRQRMRIRIHGLQYTTHRSLLGLHRVTLHYPQRVDYPGRKRLSWSTEPNSGSITRASSRSHQLPQRTWPRLSTTSVTGNPLSSPADIGSADAHLIRTASCDHRYTMTMNGLFVVNENGFAQSAMVMDLCPVIYLAGQRGNAGA
ncbi:hypothetical protein F5888DRAFT_1629759 [Russula emetica]|nr:hypothetical protein F5888DRAFT_1629759 [Russula emetica]